MAPDQDTTITPKHGPLAGLTQPAGAPIRMSCPRHRTLLIVLLTGFSALSPPTSAQDGELHLDGIADEALWRDSRTHRFEDFQVTVPWTLARPAHPTRALLRSLPEGLAVAIIVDQPANVPRVKPRAARDSSVAADRINFAVDFDGDGRIAYNFMVTLGRGIADEVITNENIYSTDWDGVWQWALHEADDHWSVEMLIPWSVASMRESDAATRRIGVHFDRVLASTNERSGSAPISYQRPRYVSDFARIEVDNHRNKGLLSIVPYVSAQYDFADNDRDARTGVDLFWKPSGNFQLSATLNPDFGQVEADDLVVDFSAIEVFFSDKRPFFTENQGIFDLRTPDSGRLVYTRRFGGSGDHDGQASDIDAAVKLNGNLRGIDYGTLAVLESDHADDLGRAFFVQRLKREFDGLSVGWLGTFADRPFRDRQAMVNGVDLTWRPSPQWLVSGQVLDSRIREQGDRRDGSGAWFRAFYTPDQRFQHELELTHFDRRLNFNDVGYQRRGNYNELEWTSTWRQTGFADDDWRRSLTWAVEPMIRYNDQGDRLPSALALSHNLVTRNGGTWYGELIGESSGVDDLIARGNGLVHRDPRLASFYQYYESPRVGDWVWFAGLFVTQEGNDGGYAVQPEGILRWFPRDDLDFRVSFFPRWSQDWLLWQQDTLFASYRRKQNRLTFDANWYPGWRHEVRLKLQWLGIDAYAPTAWRIGTDQHLVETDESVAPFTVNSFGVQLRYRYEFGPQRELYVVYGRGGYLQQAQMMDEEFGHRGDGMGDLFGNVLDLRDADQVLVKLRWGF